MTTANLRRWAVPAAVALAVLPFLASAIALIVRVGGDYHPSADQALIELQIRDIGHQPVLLGPYSRFGWFHPGPMLYYLLWLPYRLTGSSSLSLAFAALVVNVAALVGIALIARRRGGLPLVLLTLVLVGLLTHALGAQFFRDVWNPYITVLPFVLLVFLAWSMSSGDAWALPIGAAVATFLVQTHVSYGLVSATVLGAGVVGACVTLWRRRAGPNAADRRRAWLGMLVVTAVALGVLWAPVVIQQLTRDPGNLGALLRFFRDHHREQSYADAWHVVASQLSAWPDWLRGAGPLNIYSGAVDLSGGTPLAITVVVLAAAGVVAWRGARGAFRLVVIVGLTLVAAFVSVSRIVGEIFPYLIRWTWALGMLTWLAIAWALVAAWRDRPAPRSDRDRLVAHITLGVAAVALAAVSLVNTVDAAGAGNLDASGSTAVAHLSAEVRKALPSGDGVVEIRSLGTAGSTWIGAGIADDLEHHGITTRVAPDLGFAYGPDRVIGDEQPRLVVLPVEDADLAQARALPGFEEVGRVGKYTLFISQAPKSQQ
jgi:hypothetical protein